MFSGAGEGECVLLLWCEGSAIRSVRFGLRLARAESRLGGFA